MRLGRVVRFGALGVSALLAACASRTDSDAIETSSDAIVGGATTRDGFGVPHSFAQSEVAKFKAFGYEQARDRLFQMELNRRGSRGTLSEIFGEDLLESDYFVRTVGYTDGEMLAMFQAQPQRDREAYAAYVQGINAYIAELSAHPERLPAEFVALGLGAPTSWTVVDTVSVVTSLVYQFVSSGGTELQNLDLLTQLSATNGPSEGYAIFDDLLFDDDRGASTTVPSTGAVNPVIRRHHDPRQSRTDGRAHRDRRAEQKRAHKHLGIPTKLGSQAYAVSGSKSTTGLPLLWGAPQVGFQAPETFHEFQRTDPQTSASGIGIPGMPQMVIGHTDTLAWTLTTAEAADTADIYQESYCDPAGGLGSGYLFNGACRAFETRLETFNIAGQAAVVRPIARSVHGPVLLQIDDLGIAFSMKRGVWKHELDFGRMLFSFERANSFSEFQNAVEHSKGVENVMYADKQGNIAYWQSGEMPLRAPGFDPRLPIPGDGSAEWSSTLVPQPKSINPTQGYLMNWNCRPTLGYPTTDFLPSVRDSADRSREIDRLLKTSGKLSPVGMVNIAKDVARFNDVNDFGGGRRDWSDLRPYVYAALNAVPPNHPDAAAARALLNTYDGNNISDVVNSTGTEPGWVVKEEIVRQLGEAILRDETGATLDNLAVVRNPLLLRILRSQIGHDSSISLSHDWFNGQDPATVVSRAFVQALTQLRATYPTGSLSSFSVPRGTISFNHPLFGTLATVPASNRGTFTQLIEMRSFGAPLASTDLSIGNSGNFSFDASGNPVPAAHAFDQLPLFVGWTLKAEPLWRSPDGP